CSRGDKNWLSCSYIQSPSGEFAAHSEYRKWFLNPQARGSVCVLGKGCRSVVSTKGSGRIIFYWKDSNELQIKTDGKILLSSEDGDFLESHSLRVTFVENIKMGVNTDRIVAYNPDLCHKKSSLPL